VDRAGADLWCRANNTTLYRAGEGRQDRLTKSNDHTSVGSNGFHVRNAKPQRRLLLLSWHFDLTAASGASRV
jgi:hypothetical protein